MKNNIFSYDIYRSAFIFDLKSREFRPINPAIHCEHWIAGLILLTITSKLFIDRLLTNKRTQMSPIIYKLLILECKRQIGST